ncbi:MAG: hypothetical protein WC936_02450 [Candidatus Nanoarchaeia archaeon]|jgi:hypothetical protein
MKNDTLSKELGIEELLKETYMVYKKNFKEITIPLLIYLPVIIIFILAISFLILLLDSVYSYLILIVLLFIVLLTSLFLSLYIFSVTNNYYESNQLKLKQIVKQVLFKLPKALLTSITVVLFISAPFIITMLLSLISRVLMILLIPSLFLMIKNTYYWFFSIYIPLVNNKSGINAIKFSKGLVKKRWWKTFLKIFIFSTIASLSSMGLSSSSVPIFFIIPAAILSLLASGYCMTGHSIILLNYIHLKK